MSAGATRGLRGSAWRDARGAAGATALAAGCAWLAGAVATGQRYPGLSRAWLGPALLGGLLAAVALLALAGVAARWGRPSPLRAAGGALAPLALAWLLLAALALSPDANHYFANWPRLRVAAAWLLIAGAAAGAEVALLRWLRCRPGRQPGWRRLRPPALAAAGCLAVYLASAGGHLYTPDEWTIYAVGAGIATHGWPAAFADEPYPLHLLGRAAGEQPAGPFIYGKYPVLPSLLAAPLYELARLVGPGAQLPAQPFPYENRALPLVPVVLNTLLSAGCVLLLVLSAGELGYGHRAALVAAAAFVFGSLAWPYSKTLLNMTPAAAGLMGSFWCLLRARRPPGPADDGRAAERSAARWLAGAGAAAGLAAAARYESLLLSLPLLALAAGDVRLAPRRAVVRAAWFGAGLALAAGPLVLGMNTLRSGSPFDAGYGAEGTLGALLGKPWYGWFGLLFSPGCGLVPHVPLMALGIVALIWLWEDAPAPALASGAMVLLALAYYGSLETTWCAFATWGPRYLLVVAPFTALPLAALWQRTSGRHNPFLWLIGGGLALWSAGTNLLAVLIDFNRGWQDHWSLGVTYLETSWVPFFSGITAHLRLLRQWLLDDSGGIDLYLWYVHPFFGPALVVLLLALGLACWTLAWIGPPDDREAAQGPPLGEEIGSDG